jgi:ABC-type polysaccharide/polyol phosphate export permease
MQSKNQQNTYELLWVLAKTDFKLRYHGSFLGYIWALLKPLLIFLVLNFVFANIFGPGIPYYSLNLLTGIMLWNFFAEGTLTGLTSLMNKAGIITKIALPKWVIVISSTLNVLMTFLLSLVILAVFFISYKVFPDVASILWFLGICVMTYGIIVIFSLLTAPLFLKLRDLNQIWEVLLIIGFYAAPIIYPIEAIPSGTRALIALNPMTHMIQWSKEVLINGTPPPLLEYFVTASAIIIVYLIASKIFTKTSARAAENV